MRRSPSTPETRDESVRSVFRMLADVTVVAHFAFILFVVLGGFLVARRRATAYVHAPALAWAVATAATGWRCPLTMLEKWFRAKGDMGGRSTSDLVNVGRRSPARYSTTCDAFDVVVARDPRLTPVRLLPEAHAPRQDPRAPSS